MEFIIPFAVVAIIIFSYISKKLLIPKKLKNLADHLNIQYSENPSHLAIPSSHEPNSPVIHNDVYYIFYVEKGTGKHKQKLLRVLFKPLNVKNDYYVKPKFFKPCPNWKKAFAYYAQKQSILGINLNFTMQARVRLTKSHAKQKFFKRELEDLFKPIIQNLLFDDVYKKLKKMRCRNLHICTDGTYTDLQLFTQKSTLQAIKDLNWLYCHLK